MKVITLAIQPWTCERLPVLAVELPVLLSEVVPCWRICSDVFGKIDGEGMVNDCVTQSKHVRSR